MPDATYPADPVRHALSFLRCDQPHQENLAVFRDDLDISEPGVAAEQQFRPDIRCQPGVAYFLPCADGDAGTGFVPDMPDAGNGRYGFCGSLPHRLIRDFSGEQNVTLVYRGYHAGP